MTLTREVIVALIVRRLTAAEAVERGLMSITGNGAVVAELFDNVTPGA